MGGRPRNCHGKRPDSRRNICRHIFTHIHLSDISKEEHRGKTSAEQVQPELRTARRDLPPSKSTTRQRRKKNDARLTRTATTFNEDSSKDGGDQKDQCKLGRGQQNKKTQDVQNQYSLNPPS